MHIVVSVADQTLALRNGDETLATYPVSTSRHGLGTEEGSYRTPLGSFRICEKFGDGAPKNTVFRAREAVDCWDPACPCADDLVLTRILRLEGLDPENLNTYDRYIYIHGTNHEDRLGTPASQGCVRMRNDDVIDLFERTPLGTPVTITTDPA